MIRYIYIAVAVFLGAISSVNASDSSLKQPYILGPQDRIKVKVLEWLPSKGDYREWEALSGEYSVSNSGTVTLPLVGSTVAQGKSSEQVATALAEGFQTRIGLVLPPDVSVEIVAFRPIFVLGDVEKPGEYPFRPRLTVLQAVGLAGGRYRPVNKSRDYGQDVIRQTGAIEGYRISMLRAQARMARLEAEAANLNTIAFPAELRETSQGKIAIAEEQVIFDTRAGAIEEQLKALDKLKVLFDAEADILGSKIKTQEKQASLLEDELAGIRGLFKKKLAPAARMRAVERSLSELEGRRLDLTTSIMRARQKGSEALRDAVKLRNLRKTEIARSRQETRAELEQIEVKTLLARRLVFEIGLTEATDREKDAALPKIRYSIIRQAESGNALSINAREDTVLQPGDTVKISLYYEPASDTKLQPSSFGVPSTSNEQAFAKQVTK